MDIKEIAKGMTRNEFLNSIDKNGRLKYEDKAINCPGNLKLKELGEKCNIRKCQECWEQAIKDIKFKGEDKVKELTFKEVIANIKEGETYTDGKTKIYCGYGSIQIEETENTPIIGYSFSSLYKKFIKKQQPVTFQDILNSDNKCRVEHKLIEIPDEITCEDELIISDFISLQHREYLPLHSLLGVLPWILDNKDFKKVIKEGEWYLEE